MRSAAVKSYKRGAMAVLAALLTAGSLSGGSQANEGATSASSSTRGNNPADWKTWHLTTADQFRLQAPPTEDSQKTNRELRELLDLQKNLTRSQKKAVEKWNGQPAVLPWTQIALDRLDDFTELRPPAAARDLAILHTGMYDAMVAAYDSKRAFKAETRPAPAVLEPKLDPLLNSPNSTYAPVQAAMAGAAEKILAYLNPSTDPQTFVHFADKAVESRLWAGVAYRSDVQRARRLGNEVAEAVIAHVSTDGAATATGFSEPRPAPGEERAYASDNGDQEKQWQPTPNLYEPPVGGAVPKWRPWLIESGASMIDVIPGPFAYGSPQFMDELHQALDMADTLTQEQSEIAFFWDDAPGSYTPAGHWFSIAIDLAKDYGLNTRETARAFAVLGATETDAAIAFFAAKYHYWSIRPITTIWRLCYDTGVERLCTDEEAEALHGSNPALAPYWDDWFALIETPPFPAYPSGHATFSGGGGKILTYFIPEAGNTLNEFAEEAAMSRLYGGIHFNSDNQDGLTLGRAVADAAIEWAENDGSGL